MFKQITGFFLLTFFSISASADTVKVFIGQDLGAVGGLQEHNNGYVDYFGVPAGVTAYTSLSGLEGLDKRANYGAGEVETNLYLSSNNFSQAEIAIGLWLVDQLEEVNAGTLDGKIRELARWIKSSGRVIYLRIGYEFEGEWNGYQPPAYRSAFRRIVNVIRNEKVENVQYVWQSSGYNESRDNLLKFYPGDNYVDWMAYSFFNHAPDQAGEVMRTLAREKKKPVFIAEATPRGHDLMLDDGKEVWKRWFAPFLDHLEKNSDVIKAFSYINVRWEDQPMWKGQGWGDSRLQANQYISERWRHALSTQNWQHGSLAEVPKIFLYSDEISLLREARRKQRNGSEELKEQWQAEEGEPFGNARIYDDPGAAGSKGMAYIYQQGDKVSFEGVPQSNYLTLRYASELKGIIGLYVNGQRDQDIAFDGTGSWIGNYKTLALKVDIPDNSEVAIGWKEGDAAMNIDYLIFDKR